MQEIWKDIKGYEGLYQISNKGSIKSLKNKSRKLLHTPISSNGYRIVHLNKENKVKSILVHRLVAEAFVPNIYKKPQINHINGIKTDNCADNLEWCTAKENMEHACKTGLLKRQKELGRYLKYHRRIIELDGSRIRREFYSINSASKKLGISSKKLLKICLNGKNHRYKDYLYMFEDDFIENKNEEDSIKLETIKSICDKLKNINIKSIDITKLNIILSILK